MIDPIKVDLESPPVIHVTDVLGLGRLAEALWFPIFVLVVAYVNGCP